MAGPESNLPYHVGDWISRVTIPDVYHRKQDVFRPNRVVTPPDSPAASMMTEEQLQQTLGIEPGAAVSFPLTTPGPRPPIIQRALNFQLTANVTPVPVMNNQFQCDSMLFSVPTGGLSVFFGYGSSLTTTAGIEVFPGTPVLIEPENTRELWELQRLLEWIGGMIAAANNFPSSLGTYRAPRVVFNANEFFVVSTGAQTMGVMLFYVPDQQ